MRWGYKKMLSNDHCFRLGRTLKDHLCQTGRSFLWCTLHLIGLWGLGVVVVVIISVSCSAAAMMVHDNLRCGVFLGQENTAPDKLIVAFVVTRAAITFNYFEPWFWVAVAFINTIKNFKSVLTYFRIIDRILILVNAAQTDNLIFGLAGLRRKRHT